MFMWIVSIHLWILALPINFDVPYLKVGIVPKKVSVIYIRYLGISRILWNMRS